MPKAEKAPEGAVEIRDSVTQEPDFRHDVSDIVIDGDIGQFLALTGTEKDPEFEHHWMSNADLARFGGFRRVEVRHWGDGCPVEPKYFYGEKKKDERISVNGELFLCRVSKRRMAAIRAAERKDHDYQMSILKGERKVDNVTVESKSVNVPVHA